MTWFRNVISDSARTYWRENCRSPFCVPSKWIKWSAGTCKAPKVLHVPLILMVSKIIHGHVSKETLLSAVHTTYRTENIHFYLDFYAILLAEKHGSKSHEFPHRSLCLWSETWIRYGVDYLSSILSKLIARWSEQLASNSWKNSLPIKLT